MIRIVFIIFTAPWPQAGRFEQSQSFADRLESQVALPSAFLAGRVGAKIWEPQGFQTRNSRKCGKFLGEEEKLADNGGPE